MCTHIITISSEKLDELGKLLDHKHNINFSTKFSIYEKVPFTGADISESNDSKDKIRQQAKDILDKIQSHQEEEESIPEWMEGFEDLVFVEPKEEWDYLVLSKLSHEQKVFMMNMLEIDEGLLTTKLPRVCFMVDMNFPWYTASPIDRGKEIFFNDLFIPKS